jgi:tRNA nucleotidyltransferase (CCA-adding enzyme)
MKTATPRAAVKSFLDLTAADLMSTPVRTIPQDTSLREAAHLLAHVGISGAPVVDNAGRCIGVLSSSDFVTRAEEDSKCKAVHFLAPWGEIIDLEDSPNDEIRNYMTAQLVAVAPTAPIGELAQKMVDAHIHRVLVVVDQSRPQGIVTSTDILAAVARAAQGVARECEKNHKRGSRARNEY